MKLIVLGSGQDAGVPQIGCYCLNCRHARKNTKYRRYAPSVAIYDQKQQYCYLIDASLDIKYQLDLIHKKVKKVKKTGKIPVSGILLTHAHFGHYAGLLELGKESLNEIKMPVYCTLKMKKFISSSAPFNYLVGQKNILIQKIMVNSTFELSNVSFRAFNVPHRNEFADTIGFEITGKKQLIYVPDIDHWTDNILRLVNNADIAIIDGTYYSKKEILRYAQVPHPSIEQTIDLLRGSKTKIYFTHFNHTNPINYSGRYQKLLKAEGFGIVNDGMILEF